MVHRLDVTADEHLTKTVKPKSNTDEHTQLYLPKHFLDDLCIIAWKPRILTVDEYQNGRVRVHLETPEWEKRTPYQRGNASGLFAHKEHIDTEVLILRNPTYTQWKRDDA